jgi:hypothetical protein
MIVNDEYLNCRNCVFHMPVLYARCCSGSMDFAPPLVRKSYERFPLAVAD